MHLQKIPFRSTHSFTEFFLKYIDQDPSLQIFYNSFPAPGNFKKQIEQKEAFPATTRKVLVETLMRQYSSIKDPFNPVKENIEALRDSKTFTVVTGHQLNIFTGPLYFIYKIITVINACRELKKLYPAYRFVPVYWMASEDHDYEEIKSFRLYGQKYIWETNQQGAVGKFNTKEIRALLNKLPGDVSVFADAYSKNDLLSDAVRHYVNQLFGDQGLVVIDADDRELKKLLQPVMISDIINHKPFEIVEDTNKKLATLGFHAQVNPREINFFYLEQNLRSRIEKKGKDYIVVDTDIHFSEEAIRKLIAAEPEKFSPNVILRPLYQEMILPNLAYVGGPGGDRSPCRSFSGKECSENRNSRKSPAGRSRTTHRRVRQRVRQTAASRLPGGSIANGWRSDPQPKKRCRQQYGLPRQSLRLPAPALFHLAVRRDYATWLPYSGLSLERFAREIEDFQQIVR